MESITFDATPASVPAARSFVASSLREHHLEPSVAVLLTSELVGNVVLHAHTDLTVVVKVEQCVRVEVHDGMAANDAFREILARQPIHVPGESPGGRGLGLVHSLASRFGLADERGEWDGKIVWFELDDADLGLRRS